MRPPTERGQRQAKLDILIEGFMRADWSAYRDAVAWLRDFTDQKNIREVRRLLVHAATNRGGESAQASGR
jgi:hypothetical protein